MSQLHDIINKIQTEGVQKEPFPVLSFPGGYPIYYVTRIGKVICARCANDNQTMVTSQKDTEYLITGCDVNYESVNIRCDHCHDEIPAAYINNKKTLPSTNIVNVWTD